MSKDLKDEPKRNLTKSELVDSFHEQLDKIDQFCAMYDSGKPHFSQDIAVKLRVLFHQPENSRSKSKALVNTLKIDHIALRDSSLSDSLPNDDGTVSSRIPILNGDNTLCVPGIILNNGKVTVKINPRGHHLLPGENIKMVSLSSWWDSPIISIPDEKNQNSKKNYSRKDIVMIVADQIGGAHVDISLEEKIHDLTKVGYLVATSPVLQDGQPTSIPHFSSPVYPSIRQIAYEVLATYSGLDISKESKL